MGPFNVDAFQFGDILWRSMIPTVLAQGTKLEPFQRVIPTMRNLRIYPALAQTNKFVYVIGGRNENGQLSTIDSYDIANNEWLEGVEMLESVEGAAAAYMDGALYVTGGFNTTSGVKDSVWVLEKGSKVWKRLSPMCERRSNHGLVAMNGYIYALGGAGSDGTVSSSLERYDRKIERWKVLMPFQIARSNFGCVSLDRKLYVIGGKTAAGKPLRSVQVYDTTTHQWEADEPLPVGTHSMGVTITSGKIFLLGGCDGIHHLNSVYKFSPNTHIWHSLPSLGKGRIGHAAAAIRVPQLNFKQQI